MPGLANTNEFMLGTATVMIGPAEDLYDLNPTDHSIGLVKNFTATSDPSYTELTQGVKNSVVMSVMTSNPVRCTMEVYEYTAKNLAYALGLEGADTMSDFDTTTTVNGAVDGGSPGSDELTVTSPTGLTVGSNIMIINDEEGDFVVRKITVVTGNVLTVDRPLPDIVNGAQVKKVHAIGVGSKDDQPYYSAKIAGKLANGEEIVLLIPKIRIVKGFNLAFTSSDFANLPIEFTVYDLVTTDDFFEEFNGNQAMLYKS